MWRKMLMYQSEYILQASSGMYQSEYIECWCTSLNISNVVLLSEQCKAMNPLIDQELEKIDR